jgi:hypothetical protein
MSALSDYSEKLLLDYLMTAETVTRPTQWYIGLSSTASSDTGTTITEPVGNGYARESVAFAAATSPAGTTENQNPVSFTAAGGNWGTLTHIGIYTAATGGNLLWHGPLQVERIVNDGDTLTFAIGNISISLA